MTFPNNSGNQLILSTATSCELFIPALVGGLSQETEGEQASAGL